MLRLFALQNLLYFSLKTVYSYTRPQSKRFLDKHKLKHFHGITGSREEVNQHT